MYEVRRRVAKRRRREGVVAAREATQMVSSSFSHSMFDSIGVAYCLQAKYVRCCLSHFMNVLRSHRIHVEYAIKVTKTECNSKCAAFSSVSSSVLHRFEMIYLRDVGFIDVFGTSCYWIHWKYLNRLILYRLSINTCANAFNSFTFSFKCLELYNESMSVDNEIEIVSLEEPEPMSSPM